MCFKEAKAKSLALAVPANLARELNMLCNENIICVGSNAWSDLWRRRHQVTTRLAKHNRVLYIEPPVSSLAIIGNLLRFRLPEGLNLRAKEIAPNLFLCSTINFLPFSRFKPIKWINRFVITNLLRKEMKRLGFVNPILWSYFNWSFETFIGAFDEKFICYDCYDKYTGWATVTNRIAKLIETWERKLLLQADVVFAVTPELRERMLKFNNHVYVIPNGVDYELFKTASDSSVEVSPDLRGIPRPIVGYAGYISHKIDFDLMNHIAESRPDWAIVMIGPEDIVIDKEKFTRFKDRRNVHFLGKKDVCLLPNYFKGIDVCVIPYKDNEHVRHCSPNKLYEYISAGKPVVTVPIFSGFHDCNGAVKVACSKEEFVSCIQTALTEDCAEMANKRQEIAKNCTWDQRVKTMMDIVAERLDTKYVGV